MSVTPINSTISTQQLAISWLPTERHRSTEGCRRRAHQPAANLFRWGRYDDIAPIVNRQGRQTGRVPGQRPHEPVVVEHRRGQAVAADAQPKDAVNRQEKRTRIDSA